MSERRGFSKTLTLGFFLLLLTLGAAALATLLLATARLRHDVDARIYFKNLLLAERLRGEVEQTVAASRGYLLSGVPRLLERMSEAQRATDQLLGSLASHPTTLECRVLLAELKEASGLYNEAIAKAVRARRAGDDPTALSAQFERELLPRRQPLNQLLDAFVIQQQALLDRRSSELKREHARFLYSGIGIFCLGLMLSTGLAIVLGRHLNGLYRREQIAIARFELAAASREELLAIVAHDLRSPLSAIRLHATVLRNRSGDEVSRKRGEAIDRLVIRTDLLARTLLDGATIENGRLTLDVASVRVDGLLAEVVDLFAGTAAAASVRLERAPFDPDVLVLADRERAIQVLSNLVGNAIKFASPGNEVELAVFKEGGLVRFVVADNGAGIPPEQLPFLFERFWRSESRGKSGAGLGLHIARKLVEAHGGRIWAQGRPGGGTIFTFTLPAAPLDTASTEVAANDVATSCRHPFGNAWSRVPG
jgi:signal transduction histidine kinase